MLECPRTDIRDLLPDLVHDQLEPVARARVEQHVAGCAACAAELKLLRSLRASAFPTPEVDVSRVAAAVLAATVAPRQGGVVPISAPRKQRPAATGARRAVRRPAWYEWRAAAGIAAVAVGIAGYALSRGAMPALAPARESTTASAASAPSVPPAAVSGAPSPEATVAGDMPAGATAVAPSTLILGDGVTDLSESDMQALLQTVDDLEAMPDLDPRPLPLLARVVEGAL